MRMDPKAFSLWKKYMDKHYPNMFKKELRHHGVKGMRWGVRNGPPYPLDKSKKRDTIIEDSIRSGEVIRKMNEHKQNRHTYHDHLLGKSFLDGDLDFARDLINRLSGTGEPVRDTKGNWTHQERVEDSKIIGTHVDRYTGKQTKTNKGIIVYSRTGTHIYPAKPKGELK